MANTTTDIQKLYIAYFNRPADPAGLDYWTKSSLTVTQIANSFAEQAEYKAAFASQSTETVVSTLYVNMFGRPADAAGLLYWVGEINAGRSTLGSAAINILNGAKDADKVAIDSKITAATSFTTAIDTTDEIVAYSKAGGTAAAKSWLGAVTTAATATAQIAAQDVVIKSIVDGAVSNNTLTNGTDVLSGSTFSAPQVYTPGGDDRINSLQDEDVLTGTSSKNSLTATLGNSNDNGATTITPTLNNMDVVNVAFTGSGADAVQNLDLQDATRVSEVNISRVASTSNTARIENVQSVLSKMSVKNSNANNAGTVEFSFGVDVLKGDNAGTLEVSNVQVGTINVGQNTSGTGASGVGVNSYETLTLNSVGSANNIGTLNLPMDTGTAGKIVITGDKNLNLSTSTNINSATVTNNIEAVNYAGGIAGANGRLAAIDASGFTGNLTLNIGSGTFTTGKADTSGIVQNVTISGGKGNDTFYLADTIQAGDSLTGGDGTDTLTIVAGGNVNSSSSIVTKVEAVNVFMKGANSTVDFDKLPDVTGVTVRNIGNNGTSGALDADVAFTLNNLTVAQGTAITVLHSTTGNGDITQTTLNANLKSSGGTSDTVAVTLLDGVNTDGKFSLTLNAAGAENLTINNNDSESNVVELGTNADHTGTITVKGTTAATTINFDVDTAAAAGSTTGLLRQNVGQGANGFGAVDVAALATQVRIGAATFDASGEAANVIARFSTNAASAVGAQKITTGTGNDTVIFDALNDNRAGLTISDTVDGGTGTDTLVIDGNLSVAGVIALGASEWTNVSNFETIRLVNAGAGSSYSLTLTDTLISKNNLNGALTITNDNDTANDAGGAADTAGVSNESAVVIDARSLNNVSKFNYNGEEGASRTADRIIMSDVNLNGTHNINGGAVDNDATNNSQKNDDVLELRNATNASMGDFTGISNFGTIELTNDTAVSQVSQIQLNDNIVDSMVDSYQASNATTHVERLTIRALGNTNFATATVGVSLDAATLTAASALDVTLGRGANNLQLGAGTDRVVLLGNYIAGTYSATENGVSINSQSTAGAVARVVNDTINLGGGNDTLVTYGAIDLSGATLSGIENITSNSAVVITASQYNALIAARAALGLTGPVLTFSGAGPHQLTIVDDIVGLNNIDLSYISVSAGTLLYDVTSASNATGGGTNNLTTTNIISVSGSGSAIAGTVGTTPSNGGGGSTTVNLTAGGTFNGTTGITENFTGATAAFVGTTINGNSSDTDKITFTGGGSIVIGGGNTITNIKTLATDNTSSDIYFNVSTAGINAINSGTGNDRVYLANSGNSMLAGNINLGAGNNTLSLEGKTYTGTFVAGAGASDILSMVNLSDVGGAAVTGFESLVISSNGNVSLSAAQYAAFSSITALGTNNVTLSTAGTIVGNSSVENYTLANGVNTFTAAAGMISVIGGTGFDTLNISDAIITATVAFYGINGGVGSGDTLNVGAVSAALDMSVKVTGVETINVTGGTNAAWTITNANGAGTSLNFTKSASTAMNNVMLGSGGQTLNILGTGMGDVTITGGSGADTINLSASATGSDAIVAGSTISAIDTISNFKAVGADIFRTGIAATTLDSLTIATADTATLAAAIATAATAAGAALAANTQAYLITVNAGTAAGTYAFQNIGGTVNVVDATDFIVKLTGTTGSIVVGDFAA